MAHPLPGNGDRRRHTIHNWRGPGKYTLKYGNNHRKEDQWSKDRVKKYRIEATCPKRRSWSAIRCLVSQLRRPLPAFRHIVQNWQLNPGGFGPRQVSGSPRKKLLDTFNSRSLRCADQSHGRTKLLSKSGHVHLAAPLRQIVRHIQQNQGRHTKTQNRRSQHQMPSQICRIQNQRPPRPAWRNPGRTPFKMSWATCSSSDRG